MAKTDRNGRYRIENIWCNKSDPDWGKYQVGIRDSRFTVATKDVAFTSGQTITGFDFQAVPGTEIVGTLADPETKQPVAGASVIIMSGSGRQNRYTDPHGEFRSRVVPGDITALFESPPGGTYVTGQRGELPSQVNTRAFGATFPISLYLPSRLGQLGVVHGQAQMADGTPVPFCRISPSVTAERLRMAGWSGNAWRGINADAQGNFEIPTMPIGIPFTLKGDAPQGGFSGTLKSQMSDAEMTLPSPLVLTPTSSFQVKVVDLDGQPRPNLPIQVSPMIDGSERWMERRMIKTDASGILSIDSALPGTTYRISEGESSPAWSLVPPATSVDGTAPRSITLSDRYVVRLMGQDGTSVPIRSFKEFFVWILDQGRRVKWTMGTPLEVLGKSGDGVLVARKTLAVGQPGDKIDFLIESESGDFMRAEGAIPGAKYRISDRNGSRRNL